MTTIKAFIKRHPVLTYFALTFAISWGGILVSSAVLAVSRAPPSRSTTIGSVVMLAMLAGPSVAGILMTGLVSWTGGPSRAALPVAPVAGGRALVRGRAPDRPALGDGGTPCALAALPCVPPRHRHDERQGSLLLIGLAAGLSGRLLRGARLDGVRRAPAAAAVRCAGHRAHRGRAVGRVALPRDSGKRQLLRSAPAGPLARAASSPGCRPTGC